MKALKQRKQACFGQTTAIRQQAPVIPQQQQTPQESLVCAGPAEVRAWKRGRAARKAADESPETVEKLCKQLKIGDFVGVIADEESQEIDKKAGYDLPISVAKITTIGDDGTLVLHWMFAESLESEWVPCGCRGFGKMDHHTLHRSMSASFFAAPKASSSSSSKKI